MSCFLGVWGGSGVQPDNHARRAPPRLPGRRCHRTTPTTTTAVRRYNTRGGGDAAAACTARRRSPVGAHADAGLVYHIAGAAPRSL